MPKNVAPMMYTDLPYPMHFIKHTSLFSLSALLGSFMTTQVTTDSVPCCYSIPADLTSEDDWLNIFSDSEEGEMIPVGISFS